MIILYEDYKLQEQARGEIKAGDVISINHLKSLCNINLEKENSYIEMNENIIKAEA